MSTASLRARYLGDTVTTASPQQLLVMLYDRLALDLERAQAALVAGNREAAGEQLNHAQEIVLELRSSLQVDAWEGGPRLASLYSWLLTELVQANVKADRNRVASCLLVVEPLRDAWRQAAASLTTTTSATASA
jgi:flagellar protein FliS